MQLSNALDPITAADRAETALPFGPSGAGNTCIAQFTVDCLHETVLDIEHQYANCWRDYSRFEYERRFTGTDSARPRASSRRWGGARTTSRSTSRRDEASR